LGPGNSRDIRKAVPKPAKDKWFKRLLSRKSRHYESLEPSVTIDVEPQTEAMINSFLSLTAHDKAATSAHANYACKIVEKDLSETEHNANVGLNPINQTSSTLLLMSIGRRTHETSRQSTFRVLGTTARTYG
jgi:hypothetical protein